MSQSGESHEIMTNCKGEKTSLQIKQTDARHQQLYDNYHHKLGSRDYLDTRERYDIMQICSGIDESEKKHV